MDTLMVVNLILAIKNDYKPKLKFINFIKMVFMEILIKNNIYIVNFKS